MADRGIKNRFGKKSRAGRFLSLRDDAFEKAAAVARHPAEKATTRPVCGALGRRQARQRLRGGLDEKIADRARAAQARLLLPAREGRVLQS